MVQIKELGLQYNYNNDPDTRNFCGMIDGLAFLPLHRVEEGESILKEKVPAHLFDLLEYFGSSYASGP